jgi:1-acyl-sn-glycerol-3-phosphate acyltransferase
MSSSSLIVILSFFSFSRARKILVKNISFHSKFALKIFGIKVLKQNHNLDKSKNYLLVSNHHSYVDILVIASEFPACFVTSYEMKETPFLGQLCSLGGCLFVERRSKKGLSNEVRNLTKALTNKLNVVIFPEATSTNGEELKKFKRPLFQAAIDAQKEILPICLNYSKIDDTKITLKNRDKVFWYGDMTFFPHFLSILDIKQLEVELSILNPIKLDPSFTKNELADQTYLTVNTHFKPIVN